MDSDLLVLRDFLAHEGGFWPLFRPLLVRTFDRSFDLFLASELPDEGTDQGHEAGLSVMGHCCPLVAYQVVAGPIPGP